VCASGCHSADCCHDVCPELSGLRQKIIRKNEIERDDSSHNVHTIFNLAYEDAVHFLRVMSGRMRLLERQNQLRNSYWEISGRTPIYLAFLLHALFMKIAFKLNPKNVTPSY
jgi:hypothetical protein